MKSVRTTIGHKRGTSVRVKGITYDINKEGIIPEIEDEHADLLLQNLTWREYDPDDTSAAKDKQARKEAFLTKTAKDREAAARKAQGKTPNPDIVVPTLEEAIAAGYEPPMAQAIVARQAALAAGDSETEADTAGDAAVSKWEAENVATHADPPPAPGTTEDTTEAATDGGDEGEGAAAGDETEDTDEWPEPSEDLGIEKLREMADAYEVKYTARTGAKRLVADLNDAMYEDGDE